MNDRFFLFKKKLRKRFRKPIELNTFARLKPKGPIERS